MGESGDKKINENTVKTSFAARVLNVTQCLCPECLSDTAIRKIAILGVTDYGTFGWASFALDGCAMPST